MRPRHLFSFVIGLLVVATPFSALAAAGTPHERGIVWIDDDSADVTALLAGANVLRIDDALGFAVVEAPVSVLDALAQRDGLFVESDEPELLLFETPTDPAVGEQYGPEQVKAPEAWPVATGAGKTICVVDTGLRMTHEDLAGERYLGGRDFVEGDDQPDDENGHGTHVAGIAAATTGNGVGMDGVSQASLLIAKVMDGKGQGRRSDVAAGIEWCADQGADVITMSLGASRPSRVEQQAVEYAWEKGALLVAATGNSGKCRDCVAYPAALPEVIGVTCTDDRERMCDFSSTGPEAELAAPGANVISSWNTADNAYKSLSGTSMAAPHVAGVAALVWSGHPNETNAEVRTRLQQGARDAGDTGRDVEFGFGIADACGALAGVAPPPTQPPAEETPERVTEPEPAPVPVPRPVRLRADAGPSIRVTDTDDSGAENVTLDASGSSPTDDIVTYEWSLGGAIIATGMTASVDLPTGMHVISLTIVDASGMTDTDHARIRVIPPAETTRSPWAWSWPLAEGTDDNGKP